MRIVVIDDHPLVRRGVEVVVALEEDMELVGFAANGKEAAKLFAEADPHLALVDLRLPGEHGLDIVRQGREICPRCKFVVLTSYATEEEIREAMALKVDGYILKEALPEELISALRTVYKGKKYFDPAVVQYAMNTEKRGVGDLLEKLTPRELGVLAALARGLNNRAIAEKLLISEHTVKKHIGQVLEKLGLEDRTQAALFAVSRGLHKQE